MSRDLGRDVPDLEKLYARKLWADFSYPIMLIFAGLEAKGLLDFQGATWDRFRCTVEPSPGHIRCRRASSWAERSFLYSS